MPQADPVTKTDERKEHRTAEHRRARTQEREARPRARQRAQRGGGTGWGAGPPAGSRCTVVISAPESVVGIAHTRPPRTAATALAESITRPPPSATRLGTLTRARISAETSGTGPAATSWTAAAPAANSTGA